MEILMFVFIGILVGVIGAMLGIGGGIVIVPLMTFVIGVNPQMAVGTSLFVVMLNSISGAFGYLRKKLVCLKAAVIFSIATVPGALLGGYVVDYLKVNVLLAVFGVFFCFVAVNMYANTSKPNDSLFAQSVPDRFNWKLGSFCSVVIGFLASLLGIGGGIMHVPMMTYILRFPYKVAVATSTFILAVSSIAGSLSHAFMGHVIWSSALQLGIGAMVGAQLGVRFLPRVKSTILLRITALIVLITGVKFLFSVNK